VARARSWRSVAWPSRVCECCQREGGSLFSDFEIYVADDKQEARASHTTKSDEKKIRTSLLRIPAAAHILILDNALPLFRPHD